MTPELKTACELVFQEHKLSGQPVKWDRDAFRGRIAIGLSEMAKATLVKKNIIILPEKPKKIYTQLNPVVNAASSFEEAEKMLVNKIPALADNMDYDQEAYISDHVYGYAATPARYVHKMVTIAHEPQVTVAKPQKWYMRPLFYYVVWPLCAAIAGVLITGLIDLAYTKFFF